MIVTSFISPVTFNSDLQFTSGNPKTQASEDQINKFDSSINWERAVEDGQEGRGRDYLRISELEGLFNELLGLQVKERRVDHMIYMRLRQLMDLNEQEDRV